VHPTHASFTPGACGLQQHSGLPSAPVARCGLGYNEASSSTGFVVLPALSHTRQSWCLRTPWILFWAKFRRESPPELSWFYPTGAIALARSCSRGSFGGETPTGRGPPRPQRRVPSCHVQVREHRRPRAAIDADVVSIFVQPRGSAPTLSRCTAAPQIHRVSPGPAGAQPTRRASSSPARGILRLSHRPAASGAGSHPLDSQPLSQQQEPSSQHFLQQQRTAVRRTQQRPPSFPSLFMRARTRTHTGRSPSTKW